MKMSCAVADTIKEMTIQSSDTVAEGTLTSLVETSEAATIATPTQIGLAAAFTTRRHSENFSSSHAAFECDMLVLGAGPGGYSAAFRSADLGMKTVLVERYSTLGGVCLNVGCIPSKTLLHIAFMLEEGAALVKQGITFGKPQIDLNKLRAFKSNVVNKLTGGLARMAVARKVEVITGIGTFIDPYHMKITSKLDKIIVRFKKAIIAVGSQALQLPFLPADPRIIDSTRALELPQIPQRMLVIGGGTIGLEMATIYSSLGAQIDVVEMCPVLMNEADRDLIAVWEKYAGKNFSKLMLRTKTTQVVAKNDGIYVSFEGDMAFSEAQRYDLVLVAVGRSPNSKQIGIEKAGIAITERGFINVDKQMRTNVPHIFAIGDVTGQPMLAHKAVHEGHIAAEAAHNEKAYFDALQIPAVAFTNPEIAWAGQTEENCKIAGIKYGKTIFTWAALGRAISNGRDEGFTKLIFDEQTHRLIGGGIVGLNAGDLISEICLAIEMGADATDIGRTIHPHPTFGESIGIAAALHEGVCTDLLPQKKR